MFKKKASADEPTARVTIFATTSCSFCRAEATWLDEHGVAYTKKFVDQDPEAMQEFMSVNDGLLGVPLTIIERQGHETKVTGFDPEKIGKALKLKHRSE